MTVFYELCAGSAALTRKIVGLPKLLGYMGSKDRYCEQIIKYWNIPEFDSYVLNDPGFWGAIWSAYSRGLFPRVADLVDASSCLDPRRVFSDARENKDDPILERRAANRLLLLASTYGGGEIGGFKGLHKLRPSVDGFIPSRKSLAARIRNFPPGVHVYSSDMHAKDVHVDFGSYVYIDPPYKNTSKYENSFCRYDVLNVAKKWADYGCRVAVSESEPLDAILGRGWTSESLSTSSGQFRKNSRTVSEYITFNKV